LAGIESAIVVEDYPYSRAEVAVDLIEDDATWSPYLSPEDARKLDAVRLALRRGEVTEAAKYGRIFELTPDATK
jgi:hypothetical protein